jgi:hypothetical protein
MSYFSQLPDIFVAEGITSSENFKYRLVKNIFRRVLAREDLDKYTTVFETYSIRDGDTPSSLANAVCGDQYKDWVILLINNITDFYGQWPKTTGELQEFVQEKYSSVDGVHHWETQEVLYNDIVFVKEGIEVNESYRTKMPDGTIKSKEDSIYPVSNYEYEEFQNELKRNIVLPNTQIVDLIVEEFEELVEYAPSREVDTNNNKKTELSLASLFLDRKGTVYASSSRNTDIGAVTSFDYGDTTGSATATAGVVAQTVLTTTTSSSDAGTNTGGGSPTPSPSPSPSPTPSPTPSPSPSPSPTPSPTPSPSPSPSPSPGYGY